MISLFPDTAQLFPRLAATLATAHGEAAAITINDLAARFGVSRRLIERAIEENFGRFPFPLVATATGYHVPETPEEINAYAAALRGRCMRIFRRRKLLLRKAAACGWQREGNQFVAAPKQMELFPQ